MTRLLFCALLTLGFTPSAQAEDCWRMETLGGCVHLPRGLNPTEGGWADDSLSAKSDDGVLFKLWLTPFQQPITKLALDSWAPRQVEILGAKGLSGVKLAKTEIKKIGGRETGLSTFGFTIKGGARGGATVASFTGAGHVVHIRVLSNSRRRAAALRSLDLVLEKMELDDGPLREEVGRVESGAGFATTLPDGWRRPVGPEMDAVRKISATLGEEKLAGDSCWVAVKPVPGAEPGLIFACQVYHHIGVLDGHSFASEEEAVRARFFGASAAEVPPAAQTQVGDRLGFTYRPPTPLRLGLVPYAGGMVATWGVAGGLDLTALDVAMAAVLGATEFTGDGGGQPIIGLDKRVGYYLKHRPTSPMVIAPVLLLLGLIGGIVAISRKRSAGRWDVDDLD
jgi:hypothetical protein